MASLSDSYFFNSDEGRRPKFRSLTSAPVKSALRKAGVLASSLIHHAPLQPKILLARGVTFKGRVALHNVGETTRRPRHDLLMLQGTTVDGDQIQGMVDYF